MTLIRRFNNQYPNISTVFEDFFGDNAYSQAAQNRSKPAINVRENEDEYNIEVAAPGLKKDKFKVEVNNSVLTISYEDEVKNEVEEQNYTRKEFAFTNFCRSFSIPRTEVDDSKIDASYKDGILTVKLQKRDEIKPKPSRMISIK